MNPPLMDESNPVAQRPREIAVPCGRSPAGRRPRARPGRPRSSTSINVDFYYGQNKALHGINFEIKKKLVTAFIGPSGCRQVDPAALPQPHERPGRRHPHRRRLDQDFRRGYLRPVGGCDRAAQARRHGLPKIRTRSRNRSTRTSFTVLRLQGINNKARLDETVERSLRGAALWEEVRDRLHSSALGLSGGQQQRPVHRPCHRGGAGDYPHG